LKEKVNYLEN